MIASALLRNDLENRLRSDFLGLVHTQGPPVSKSSRGGWTTRLRSGPRLRERTRRLRIFSYGPLPPAGPGARRRIVLNTEVDR